MRIHAVHALEATIRGASVMNTFLATACAVMSWTPRMGFHAKPSSSGQPPARGGLVASRPQQAVGFR